jgi:hypothetical protein
MLILVIHLKEWLAMSEVVSLYLVLVYKEQVLGIELTDSTPTMAHKQNILLSIKI